jgi:YegS/Rv2252/BmrU family lipid kinase
MMDLPFGPPLVVVNDKAGRGSHHTARELVALFKQHDVTATLASTPSVESLRQVCAAAVREQRGFVIVVGGDGTVREALNGFYAVGQDVAANDLPVLGIVGAGTGSDFSRTYGLDRSCDTLIHHFLTDATTLVDVGVVAAHTSKGAPVSSHFLNVAQVGFGADVAAAANRLPRSFGSRRYRMAVPLALTRFRHRPMRVRLDGTELTEELLNVVIANGQFYGAGLPVAPQALPHDGVFDVQCWTVAPRELAAAHEQLKHGNHLARQDVRQWRSSSVTVNGPRPIPVEADGDSIGVTPATFTLKPHGIRIKI